MATATKDKPKRGYKFCENKKCGEEIPARTTVCPKCNTKQKPKGTTTSTKGTTVKMSYEAFKTAEEILEKIGYDGAKQMIEGGGMIKDFIKECRNKENAVAVLELVHSKKQEG